MSMQETPAGNNQNETNETNETNDDNNNNNNDDSKNNDQSSDEVVDKICRDYQRGVCNRRGKCKFRHPDGMGTEITNQPMICRDFQNGKCSRSTCKYMHISNSEEKVFLHTGQMPPQTGGEGRPPFSRGQCGPRGETTRGGAQDPICKDYMNRKCSRGTGCKFRHVMEEEPGFGGGGGDGSGGGGGGGYGYGDFPRKRRRESHEGPDHYMIEENESLRRKVADLQKQVATLKATNEVLLEQNARYRNQAGGASGNHDSYNSGNASSQRSGEYPSPTPPPSASSGSHTGPPSNSSNSQAFSTAYPPRDSYYTGGQSGGQYAASKDAYNASKDSYSSNNYTSNSGYGTGYTKFE